MWRGIIAGLMLWGLAMPAFATTPVTRNAEVSAEAGLERFIEVARKEPAKYGFANPEEASRLKLGEGIQVYFANLEKMAQADGQSLLAVVSPSQGFEYLLTVDGKPRILMRLAIDGCQFESVDVGTDATAFGVALENYRRLGREKGVEEPEPVLVKFGAGMILVGAFGDEELMIPVLSPDKAAGGKNNSRFWPARDLAQGMIDLWKKGGSRPPSIDNGDLFAAVTEEQVLPLLNGATNGTAASVAGGSQEASQPHLPAGSSPLSPWSLAGVGAAAAVGVVLLYRRVVR